MKKQFIRQSVAGFVFALCSTVALAQFFTIRDIRVEGIQRTEAGTVFSHLPFRVGDEFTSELGAEAIHSLYQSGLFRNVNMSVEGDVLVISLVERPAIAEVEVTGVTEFDKDGIDKTLRQIGLTEGRIFDSSILDRTDQELRRMYLAQGHYGVTVTTTTSPVERNRIKVTISVEEGVASSIKQIRFVGNSIYSSDDLLDLMQLHPHKWSSWYTKRDQYSKEKLAADLEAIRSFYLSRGYLDFKIDSTSVSVAPNKSDMFITINITEGEKYHINQVKLAGDLLGLESEIQPLLTLEKGELYNADKVNDISSKITEKYSAIGYAFCTARPDPVTDKETNTVDVIFTVDPGRRAYVRHVNITGNSITKDEVIRREVRQYEAAWFNSDKVKLSRDRIDRLGYFESVDIKHVPVEGTRDQVDVEISVKERPTGSISLGAGYSSDDGIILSAGFSQDNVFGTGNSFGVEVNTSNSSRTLAINLSEPYITPEGISRSWELSDRKVDLEDLEVADVAYDTKTAGITFGIPVTELDRIYLGARYEQTKVDLRTRTPQRYKDYVTDYGKHPDAAIVSLGWSRDSRDNVLAPTRGRFQRFTAEASAPGLDVEYYKATYQFTQYIPLAKNLTFGFNLQLGYGDAYGNKRYPFFKNFYAGGIGSVRGYESSSLGPREKNEYDGDYDYIGGNRQLIFSTEVLFPLPGMDKTLRGLFFFDGGYVWGYKPNSFEQESLNLSDLRYSAGFGIAWISPMGPLKFSLAFPIKKKEGDKTERFQFQIGTGF